MLREDPGNKEIKSIKEHVSFPRKDVIEIGCGDGRATVKYWNEPRTVVAIDPDENAIKNAEAKLPSRLLHKVRFQVGESEHLEFGSESFDIALYTWSLCCVQDTEKSVKEAWRVLRPGGVLVNVMPDAVPTFEKSFLRALGGKDPTRQGSVDAYRALVHGVRDGLFFPFKDQRIFFDVYFDSIDDVMKWATSDAGPFNKEELESISDKSLKAIKEFASTLKHGTKLRIRDILVVSSGVKRK